MTSVQAHDAGFPAFDVEVRRRGGRGLVTVGGELDIATAPVLERALIEQIRIGGSVVLDLRALTFIDATGLGLLLRTNAHARRDGTEFVLLVGPHVRRLLDVCGVASQFTVQAHLPS